MRYTSAISVKKKELSPKYMIFLKFRQKLELQTKELNHISTLSLKIPKTIEAPEIFDDMGHEYMINRNEGESLYNITTQVLNSPFSQLFIKNPKTLVIFH